MEPVSSPINRAFVLEFVLSWVPLRELAGLRRVCARWNDCFDKCVIHQLQSVDRAIAKREEELKEESGDENELEMIRKLEEDPPETLDKTKHKGQLFVNIREIARLHRPYQVFPDMAQLIDAFLERPF